MAKKAAPKKSKKAAAPARVIEAENRMYELMFILKPDLLESAITKKLKDFKKYLEENNAKVTVEDIWEKRRLAYKIKQYDEGIYVVYNFEVKNNFISELDEHLRLNNDVLRHLITIIESDYKYSKFDEEDDVRRTPDSPGEEAPKKRIKKNQDEENEASRKDMEEAKKEAPKKAPKEEISESPKEKTEEKKEKEEIDKSALDDKLDKLLDGDDLNI